MSCNDLTFGSCPMLNACTHFTSLLHTRPSVRKDQSYVKVTDTVKQIGAASSCI
jgi:hypothetical protein